MGSCPAPLTWCLVVMEVLETLRMFWSWQAHRQDEGYEGYQAALTSTMTVLGGENPSTCATFVTNFMASHARIGQTRVVLDRF